METPISNLLQRFETNMTSAPSGWRSPSPATPGGVKKYMWFKWDLNGHYMRFI